MSLTRCERCGRPRDLNTNETRASRAHPEKWMALCMGCGFDETGSITHMRWPWTSVARLDDAQAQVAYLKSEVAKLSEALTRISRREAGLPETPREAKPPMDPMPDELRHYIEGFAGMSVRKQMRDVAFRRRAQGTPWKVILSDTMTEEPS